MTLGQRLAFYRKKSCLTQQQLGKMINVSAQAVSKWENDQAEPDVTTICKLSEIYQISIDALLTGKTDTSLINLPSSVKTKRKKHRRFPIKRIILLSFIILSILAATTVVLINIFTYQQADFISTPGNNRTLSRFFCRILYLHKGDLL